MTTTETITTRYNVEQIGTTAFAVFNQTTRTYLKNRYGGTRYFMSAGGARKAITRLNRPVGDRHR